MAPPYSVEILEETGSTQDDARRWFSGSPLLVVAAIQTSGRGRAGAEWRTAPRALAASLAWTPGWDRRWWPLLPLLAGLAAVRTVGVSLKWPNDIGGHGVKLGGILGESMGGSAGGLVDQSEAEPAAEAVVVGMGLNLWWPSPPEGMGALYESDPGPATGAEIARSWCEQLLGLASGAAPDWPREEYLAACTTVGRQITWQPDGAGLAVGVDEMGGLVVETASGPVILRSGEVRHVR